MGLHLCGQCPISGANPHPYKYSCWTAKVYEPLNGSCELDTGYYRCASLCNCETFASNNQSYGPNSSGGVCEDLWRQGFGDYNTCNTSDTLVVYRSSWVEILIRPYLSKRCIAGDCIQSWCGSTPHLQVAAIEGPGFIDTCCWWCDSSGRAPGIVGCSSFSSPDSVYAYASSCSLQAGTYVQHTGGNSLYLRLVDLRARWAIPSPLTACMGQPKTFCVEVDRSSWMYVQAVHFYVGNTLVGTN